MSKKEESKLKRQICQELYIEKDKSVKELVILTGVNEKTIYRWKVEDEWDIKKDQIRTIEKQIYLHSLLALSAGLKAYSEKPHDKDLQSLVSMLKQYQAQHKPDQQYKDHVLKFIDRAVDFFLEKEMPATAQIFQTKVKELAEYLLRV